MKILLVSATPFEIEPAIAHFKGSKEVLTINNNSVNILITGVGMTATAFSLGSELAVNSYNLAINAGIAGAFDRSLKIGDVVRVGLDCFADLGAEHGEDFLSIDELGFGKASIRPETAFEHPGISSIRETRSITVNKVHGSDESIYSISERLNPETETMEGAAFFYGCNKKQVPCLQLRSISNYVESRNRNNWNIPLAIKNLNHVLIEILTSL